MYGTVVQYVPFNNPISAGTIEILFLNSCNSFNFRMFENISGAIEEILLSPKGGERGREIGRAHV